MELIESQKDNRGQLFVFKEGNEEYVLSKTNKGSFRAGHYHTGEENFFVVEGKVEVVFKGKDTETGGLKATFSSGGMFKALVNEVHLVQFLEDSIILQWNVADKKTVEIPSLRKFVENTK